MTFYNYEWMDGLKFFYFRNKKYAITVFNRWSLLCGKHIGTMPGLGGPIGGGFLFRLDKAYKSEVKPSAHHCDSLSLSEHSLSLFITSSQRARFQSVNQIELVKL